MYGIEVKVMGQRKKKWHRLSVSMAHLKTIWEEAPQYVEQYAKDFGMNVDSLDYRIVDRDSDSVVAVKR